jgi:hypothetical protein
MSWIDTLSNMTKNVGRGALDVFTLGGNELGHKFGGQGYQSIMKPVETGFGANFEAGAVGGGLGQLGGAMGGGSAMTSYAPTSTPMMSQAGSTMGAGMSSPMNLAPAAGSQMGAAAGTPVASAGGPSAVSQALNYMRMMPQGGSQNQAPASQDTLQKIYHMFPGLKPGSSMGGFNG